MEVKQIALSKIRAQENYRKQVTDATLKELAESIKLVGLLQPILVKQSSDKKTYEIVAGHRRYAAFELLKKKDIPASIIQANELQSESIQLIENIQREEVDLFDEAEKLSSMVKNMGADAVIKATGLKLSYLRSREILVHATSQVRDLYRSKSINLEYAIYLAGFPANIQFELVEMIVRDDEGSTYIEPLQSLKNKLERKAVDLKKANFDIADPDLKDGNLKPGQIAGSCINCSYNTNNSDTLFVIENPQCLSPKCFAAKQEIAAKIQVKNGAIPISQFYSTANKYHSSGSFVQSRAKDALSGVIVEGYNLEDVGKTIHFKWVDRYDPIKRKLGLSPKAKEARDKNKEAKQQQKLLRQARINTVAKTIDALKQRSEDDLHDVVKEAFRMLSAYFLTMNRGSGGEKIKKLENELSKAIRNNKLELQWAAELLVEFMLYSYANGERDIHITENYEVKATYDPVEHFAALLTDITVESERKLLESAEKEKAKSEKKTDTKQKTSKKKSNGK